jgi:MFS family permease
VDARTRHLAAWVGGAITQWTPASARRSNRLVSVTAGIALAAASTTVAIWIISAAAIAVGIGAANTASIGVLFHAVGTERIIAAMLIWSQLGIIGYLAGPLAGGATAQSLGYPALGLVPLSAAVVVAAMLGYDRLAPAKRD